MSQVAKEEAEEKLKALFKKDASIKALKDEISDRKAIEEKVKKEAYKLARVDVITEILIYEMSFNTQLCL